MTKPFRIYKHNKPLPFLANRSNCICLMLGGIRSTCLFKLHRSIAESRYLHLQLIWKWEMTKSKRSKRKLRDKIGLHKVFLKSLLNYNQIIESQPSKTYWDITCAMAAPLTPIRNTKMNSGSSAMFVKSPATGLQQTYSNKNQTIANNNWSLSRHTYQWHIKEF